MAALTMESLGQISRRALLICSGAVLASACTPGGGSRSQAARARDTMRRATDFMRENCAYRGGYLWSYADDFSRRWGEMEAFPTMIWIQPPGTATVGHLYLDCYHATGDEDYYEAASDVADGLIAAQHTGGGWNYLHDFAGEDSIRQWYETIGGNGWRLEEFHHYYGNATFDDAGTSEASQFLLRLYVEKRDESLRGPVDRALNYVLASQYGNGGWPQRYPFVDDAPSLHGLPDYTRHVTFNDDVGRENIKFLLMVWQTLGDQRARDAIDRAMDVFVTSQQQAPQAGWGLQHTADDLRPAAARSYEPAALVTSTTAANVGLLLDFCDWTGNRRYIERVPAALDWLASVRLPPAQVVMPGREYPTFIEIGSNRPLFNHRRGSNVVNGSYYHDYDPDKPIRHYSQWRAIDLDALRARYDRLAANGSVGDSPLARREGFRLPSFFTNRTIAVSDLNSNVGASAISVPSEARIDELNRSLSAGGYWATPLTATSNPYIGPGSPEPAEGDFSQTLVGDSSDTSPYVTDKPQRGISTGAFIRNMSELMQFVARS